MAKILFASSADGLGLLAAKEFIKHGHEVILHARNKAGGQAALKQLPGVREVLIADLSEFEKVKALSAKVNASDTFDAVIHNFGVYQTSAQQHMMRVLACWVNARTILSAPLTTI